MRLPSISLKPMPDAQGRDGDVARAGGGRLGILLQAPDGGEGEAARPGHIHHRPVEERAPRAQVVPLHGLFQAGAGRVRDREAAGLGGLRDAAPFRDPPLRVQHRGRDHHEAALPAGGQRHQRLGDVDQPGRLGRDAEAAPMLALRLHNGDERIVRDLVDREPGQSEQLRREVELAVEGIGELEAAGLLEHGSAAAPLDRLRPGEALRLG